MKFVHFLLSLCGWHRDTATVWPIKFAFNEIRFVLFFVRVKLKPCPRYVIVNCWTCRIKNCCKRVVCLIQFFFFFSLFQVSGYFWFRFVGLTICTKCLPLTFDVWACGSGGTWMNLREWGEALRWTEPPRFWLLQIWLLSLRYRDGKRPVFDPKFPNSRFYSMSWILPAFLNWRQNYWNPLQVPLPKKHTHTMGHYIYDYCSPPKSTTEEEPINLMRCVPPSLGSNQLQIIRLNSCFSIFKC